MDDYREELIELIVFHSQETAEGYTEKFDRDLKQEDTFNYFANQTMSWDDTPWRFFDFLEMLSELEFVLSDAITKPPHPYVQDTYDWNYVDHPDLTMRDFAIHLIDQISKEDIKHVHNDLLRRKLLRRKNEREEFLKKREEER